MSLFKYSSSPKLVIDKVKLLGAVPVVLEVVQKAAAKGRRKVSAYLTLRRPSPAPTFTSSSSPNPIIHRDQLGP